mmetsp:Transcript_29407/g.77078  ORF Transcript_29407/g.77078 Transcript_29407/m.77078 type:complete len:120 (+) Transcript_29407:108-467(+)
MSTVVELEIFSPRWGHEDTYEVNLTQDLMEVSMDMRKCKLTWIDGCDPEWSGEALEDIMGNDNIYPPAVTARLFEYAWKAWRDGELNDQAVADELRMVADWINAGTKTKPRSDFWRKYF